MKAKTFLLVFMICNTLQAQNNAVWNELKASVHKIGFCIYNVNEAFCKEHKEARAKYEMESSEDEDVNYFAMKEEWAKKRVKGWAKKQMLDENALLLLFDIDQGYKYKFKKNRVKPNNKYFILNLKDDLSFKIKRLSKKQALKCAISHRSKPNMLENTLWREFMTGRLGLIKNNVEFNVLARSKMRKKIKAFKECFYAYREKFCINP